MNDVSELWRMLTGGALSWKALVQRGMDPWSLAFVLSFLLACLLIRLSIGAAHRFDILARPSERASHTIPTPRLAGLGIGIAFYVVVLLMYGRFGLKADVWVTAVIVGGAYALIGGFLDDILELPPHWKFLFQFAAAGSVVVLGFGPRVIEFPSFSLWILPPWLSGLIAFGFIVFLMNAYNFMDGMDGQAALFGVIVSMAILTPLAAYRLYPCAGQAFALSALAGGLIALFVFNHPGARQEKKTFMGDSGSQFVGFQLAMLSLHSGGMPDTGFSYVAVLIVLSPFVWDVCYTLLRRMSRRENVFEAHRSHLYQRLLKADWSHGRTLLLNALVWVACFVLSQIYAFAGRAGWLAGRYLCIAATFLVLLLYTMIVWAVEGREKRC